MCGVVWDVITSENNPWYTVYLPILYTLSIVTSDVCVCLLPTLWKDNEKRPALEAYILRLSISLFLHARSKQKVRVASGFEYSTLSPVPFL